MRYGCGRSIILDMGSEISAIILSTAFMAIFNVNLSPHGIVNMEEHLWGGVYVVGWCVGRG